MKPFLLVALLACSLAACGDDQAVSSTEADQIASKPAQKTQSLSAQVAEASRARADDPDEIAEAAGTLAEGDPGSRDEALGRIEEARDHVAEAADRLAGKLPPDARKDLDDLRERLSSSATP